jgi:hypothetical protein
VNHLPEEALHLPLARTSTGVHDDAQTKQNAHAETATTRKNTQGIATDLEVRAANYLGA